MSLGESGYTHCNSTLHMELTLANQKYILPEVFIDFTSILCVQAWLLLQCCFSKSYLVSITDPHVTAGWAVQEKVKRGFLDDWRLGAELVTTDVFDAVRWLVRKALFMPEKQNFSPFGIDGRRSGWMGDSEVCQVAA